MNWRVVIRPEVEPDISSMVLVAGNVMTARQAAAGER
jgi:hypothetical protein